MVLWAQRPSLIILTFCVEDCKEPEIKLESDKLHFKGVGGPDKKQHELTIDFFKEVDTEVRIFIISIYLALMLFKTDAKGQLNSE